MTEFARKVYEEARKIPPGKTITYGELAGRIGHPGAARAVGTALKKNPFVPEVPCHRVVRSDGNIGGYARGGTRAKISILRQEGVLIMGKKIITAF